MNRRSLLGLLFAAPIAAPAAIKAAMVEQPYTVGEVIARTVYSSGLAYGAADLGNVITGLIFNADGSLVMDLASGVVTLTGYDVPAPTSDYWDDLDEIYDEERCEYDGWDDEETYGVAV